MIHALMPTESPTPNRPIGEYDVEGIGPIEEPLEEGSRDAQTRKAPPDRREIPRPPDQIVINGTGDGTGEDPEVDSGFLSLPINPERAVAIHFLTKMPEQIT